jgi:uncharacterized protein involved in outer membrane biogenesis
MDWNRFRDDIAEQSRARLGRTLRIDGDLRVRLLRACPRVDAEKVELENASWAADERMFMARHVGVALCVWPLLKRELHFDDLELDDARIALEQRADGTWNTAMETRGKGKGMGEKAETPETDRLHSLPVWKRLAARDVVVTVQRPGAPRVVVVGSVSSERATKERPVAVQGHGTVQGQPFSLDATLEGKGGDALALEAHAKLAGVTASVKGTTADASRLDPLNADVKVSAHGLSELAAALGWRRAGTVPPLELSTAIARDGETVRIGSLQASLGRTSIAGWIAVDTGERLAVRGALKIPRIVRTDVASLKAAPPRGEPATKGAAAPESAENERLFSEKAIDTSILRKMDADIELTVGEVLTGEAPKAKATKVATLFDDLRVKAKLAAGHLRLEPLRVGIAGGVLDAKVDVDARQAKALAASVDASLRRIDIERIIAPFAPDRKLGKVPLDQLVTGKVQGAVKLAARGASEHALASSLDGNIGLTVEDGRIDATIIEVLGLDLPEAIGSLTMKRQTYAMDCLLVKVDAKDGVLRSDGIVLGTTDSNIIAKGSADLGKEELDVDVHVLAKDFSIGSFAAPLQVRGSLRHPKVSVAEGPLLARIASAVGLGALLGPVGAALPLTEPGAEKSGRCHDYVARIKAVEAKAKVAH